ncbi:replication factor A [Nitzschia inconspicua]|uniref:Replication factor A n=1 Tax=Nitzschia inconspicua TaxID=303405 RepID=A0A9K3L588_9STRA|nr:replication factor A [Nitzschia inconspicua]
MTQNFSFLLKDERGGRQRAVLATRRTTDAYIVQITEITRRSKEKKTKRKKPLLAMDHQPDGSFPRINGGMMQKDLRYAGKLVSLVGRVTEPNKLLTADGTLVNVDTEPLQDGTLMVNPDLCVEIMGAVSDATTISAFVCRELSTDMDLNMYNNLIVMMQQPKYAQYFGTSMMGVGAAPTN